MKQNWLISLNTALTTSEEMWFYCWLSMCPLVRGSGACRSVPVSEIIAVREEEEENRDDGSWTKIKEMEGKDCGQAFTGVNICSV